MTAARTTRKIDRSRSYRSQRSAAAAVAEYIHELSNRHAGARRRGAGGRRDLITQDARQALGAPGR